MLIKIPVGCSRILIDCLRDFKSGKSCCFHSVCLESFSVVLEDSFAVSSSSIPRSCFVM